MRGRIFLIGICILLIGTIVILNKKANEVKDVVQLNVINAKYDNGFVIIELEDSEEYKTVEEYSIDKIKIINIQNEKPYLKKYFTANGRLINIELFYNDSLI